jgi:inulin fructotransferase (DFA-I-forming)
VIAVQVEPGSTGNTILDSGSDIEVLLDKSVNAFRGTPVPGQAQAQDSSRIDS